MMTASVPNNAYLASVPPGFAADPISRNMDLIERLNEVIGKYTGEPQLVHELSQQTDLLFSVVQYVLLPRQSTNGDRRVFLQQIRNTVDELIHQATETVESSEPMIATETSPPTPEQTPPPSSNENSDLSLNDLAQEYLQDKFPSSPATATSENQLQQHTIEIPVTQIDDRAGMISSPLDTILFSNQLSSQNAADGADCIWKEESSSLGQIFCKKIPIHVPVATKRSPSCLFDRTLYERLSRLIELLPKYHVPIPIQRPKFEAQGYSGPIKHLGPRRVSLSGHSTGNRKYSNQRQDPRYQGLSPNLNTGERSPESQSVADDENSSTTEATSRISSINEAVHPTRGPNRNFYRTDRKRTNDQPNYRDYYDQQALPIQYYYNSTSGGGRGGGGGRNTSSRSRRPGNRK